MSSKHGLHANPVLYSRSHPLVCQRPFETADVKRRSWSISLFSCTILLPLRHGVIWVVLGTAVTATLRGLTGTGVFQRSFLFFCVLTSLARSPPWTTGRNDTRGGKPSACLWTCGSEEQANREKRRGERDLERDKAEQGERRHTLAEQDREQEAGFNEESRFAGNSAFLVGGRSRECCCRSRSIKLFSWGNPTNDWASRQATTQRWKARVLAGGLRFWICPVLSYTAAIAGGADDSGD